jgi:hypothetical protein
MASIPQSPRAQIFAEATLVFTFGNHYRRATKRLIAGIIDCAFEIAKKLRRKRAFGWDLIELVARKPSIRSLGKIFSPEDFPPSLFRKSGGFQDE